MPRRSIFSITERESLLAISDTHDELIKYYSFSESDLAIIRQRRGDSNRLGFAIHLCYMRYPGIILGINDQPFLPLLEIVANQLKISIDHWQTYGQREQTRREHLIELQIIFGFQIFSTSNHYLSSLSSLEELACQTDKGIVLAAALIENLRKQNILIPPIDTIERLCSEAITRANRRIFKILTESLSTSHLQRLDNLLKCKDNSAVTWLMWLHQSPLKPNSRYMLEHIDRLKVWKDIDLPTNLKSKVHQNRLLKIAREGKQMISSNLSKLEHQRRYATLVALSIEGMATVIDEIIELHERIIGKLFSTAKHKHQEKFHSNGKAINDKLRLYSRIGQSLLEARENSKDPFQAIEAIISWDTFIESVKETHTLVQTESFDFLHHIKESYSTLRRYAPKFLDILILKAAPSAQPILDAIHVLKEMNTNNIRKVPNDISTGFVKPRWRTLVFTKDGIDRQYYELCLFVELKNSLRSGDIWVQGSRHFKDFNEYLIPLNTFEQIKTNPQFPLPVNIDFEQYMMERLFLLENQLEKVNCLAATNSLPDAIINTDGLKIIPLDANVPKAAQELIDHISMMLPNVKITEILMEVDEWTNFTQHFIHLKSGNLVKDKEQLLTTILADGINLGLHKMAQSCPGTTYPKLSWIQAWYIRDETYTAALAELTNKQLKEPFSYHWGKGITSSSDGQRFRVGSKAEYTGHINLKYGTEPGRMFYTHISDQYSPFNIKVVNVGVRDSTYVLDGLLYHESDIRIEEHYTDTAGFTDHVFALMHLLGFRFAPRIRDLGETKLYIPKSHNTYDAIKTMISSDRLNIKAIRTHWNDILRLATSIKNGTVTASLMLRKLGGYPRQNGLAIALRELGRIERTIFILDWLQSIELRRRVQVGLNKGEARNALAKALFFNRLGEIRDRNFEQQRYRASGLNLLTSSIVLWNTVYIERAVKTLRENGYHIDDTLLQYLSPLGWEHINLTGDYVWSHKGKRQPGKFRPLRTFRKA